MKDRPILFLDSGIGGLPYCRDFIKRNPKETVYYLADREHFPYGPKSKEEIIDILTSLTEKLIKKIDPKIAVLACNTASISALEQLRLRFPKLPFVGTVPAIKPAAYASKSGIVGVLATARTIQDIHSLKLEGNRCKIFGIAAPELVEIIENGISEKEKTEIISNYINQFIEADADTLVLGCTHFLYFLEDFKRIAFPKIKIFESLDGITKRIEFLLDENDCLLRATNEAVPSHLLILTGTQQPDSLWLVRAKEFNFKLCLLNEVL